MFLNANIQQLEIFNRVNAYAFKTYQNITITVFEDFNGKLRKALPHYELDFQSNTARTITELFLVTTNQPNPGKHHLEDHSEDSTFASSD